MKKGFLAGLAMGLLLFVTVNGAFAAILEYSDFSAFNHDAGPLTTIDFTNLSDGTTLSTQYASLGATFMNGNDTIFSNSGLSDQFGIAGNGSIEIEFSEPIVAIGVDFPGSLKIDLYDSEGGSLLYSSNIWGGSGWDFFGGIEFFSETPFTYAVLSDPLDHSAFIDNLHFSAVSTPVPSPEPATMLLLGTGIAGLVGSKVRRKKK